MATENEAIGKMVQDYQTVLRRMSCIANELHTRARSIERVTGLLDQEPSRISAVQDGFRVPSNSRLVVEEDHTLSFPDLSLEELHEDLLTWAELSVERARLESLLRNAGLPNIIKG